jgi:hypothetical protein
MKSPTYEEIASSYPLWLEFCDIDGHDTKEWFDKTDVQEKVEFLIHCFGEEKAI